MRLMTTAAAFLAVLIVIVSCKSDTVLGPNEIGGNTNLPLTQVGNVTSIYVNINGSSVPVEDTMYITKSDNGIVTYKIKANLAGLPLASIIPADLKDSSGNLNADMVFKITSDGIQEFYTGKNDMSKPFTIAKSSANVGDQYEFTTSTGKHIVRTVTEKTGVDEWPVGMYLIKTIKTEQVGSQIDSVSKVTFRTNHKYGLVYVEFTLLNGSIVKINLMPWNV